MILNKLILNQLRKMRSALSKKTITEILSEFLPLSSEEIYRETISCLATEEYFLFTGEQIKDILDSVLAAFDFS